MHVEFGYRCSAEEYTAPTLLQRAIAAEQLGFDFLCMSDHFHPWFHEGGNASHPWVLMGATGASTSKVRIGTGITAPIYRYHPAIIAQAFATLNELFPGRIFLGLGTGEAMNEVPLGFEWRKFTERLEIVREALEIIRLLWTERFVDYNGKYFTLRNASLYMRPNANVPVYVAAYGETMARFAGREGDAFLTTGSKLNEQGRRRIESVLAWVKEGVREVGRNYDTMHKMIEFFVVYDEDYEKAFASAEKWRATEVPHILAKNVHDPRELDKLGRTVSRRDLEDRWLVTTDMEDFVRATEDYARLGFDEIQFHSSSPNEGRFLEEFGKKILPYLKENYRVK